MHIHLADRAYQMKHRERINKEYQYQESEDSYEIGCQWIQQNDLEKAEKFIKKAIELNEYFIYAYVTLAEIYEKQQRWHDAIHVLKKASVHDPAFDRLYLLMARNSLSAGDFIASLRFIDRAISANPLQEYLDFRETAQESMRQP